MLKSIKLQSCDSTEYVEVSYEVANMSKTIKNMIDDFGENISSTSVPLNNVTFSTLNKVVEYCYHHLENPKSEKDINTKVITEWETRFCTMDQVKLFDIILAANYLDIKPLLDLTCLTVANMIKGKTPEEIRKTFNIKNTFTPEEEPLVEKENEWCS